MKKYLKLLAFLVIFSTALFIYLATQWLAANYQGISMQEIAFHILMPLGGTSAELLDSFFDNVVKPALLASITLLMAGFLVTRWTLVVQSQAMGTSLDIGRLLRRVFSTIVITASVTMVLLSTDSLVYDFRLDSYLKTAFKTTDLFKREYIYPESASIVFPQTRRNLVFIFMESIESTFFRSAEGGYYQEDIMPELRELAEENVHFSNSDKLGGAAQASGSGWTVAALVSHTLGIPLLLPINGNAYQGYGSFLGGADGLTDILSEAGYTQRFLIGSDKKFAGRDTLYETHGKVLVKDTTYYKAAGKIPEDYSVWWGFEDEKLYALAREELTDLAAKPEPFNLMLLTVDTHHVGGYVCALCDEEFDTQYKNVLACASRQAAAFVKWIQEQPWYENTTIVIVGDHLYMDGSFVPLTADRRTYNVYINSVASPSNTRFRQFSALDTFPSVLDSMGVQYKGNGLALGRSLFRDTETLLEKYGSDYLNAELVKRNAEYYHFLYGK